ncbi:hypothetical protein [Methanolobus halotolerans]|nr:hypothetical protein [Methanolobus halotolerans]
MAQTIAFANQRDAGTDIDSLIAAMPVESDGEGNLQSMWFLRLILKISI